MLLANISKPFMKHKSQKMGVKSIYLCVVETSCCWNSIVILLEFPDYDMITEQVIEDQSYWETKKLELLETARVLLGETYLLC